MRNIIDIGFDMDYTLAQYKSETFESLAYEGTVKKLVYDLGYPSELLEWTFDWNYMVRGLVLDKKKGNILKMDRHKYVKVAYHGFNELSKEDKVDIYESSLIQGSFDEPDYALIDTLFSLAEANLFAQLVDFKDNNPEKILNELRWRTMLVVPELEKEVELLWELRDMRKQLILMRNEHDSVGDKIHHLNWSLKFEDINENDKKEMLSALKDLEFHKVWGQLMKTGYQSSRFVHQVERFACLYTSQVSNLRLYSPDKYYRPSEDFMSHEFDLLRMD
ncbi:unnamed protein product [Eruca vesicaria subsp. sativa]|uniref:HAD family hydrolase n=1 Tax=Eruca vesicaria subsp. sativa TaxID=29727 RepID=A0ABC8KZZ3_ERUVS|nr:unnamed protein product [Eruca vesicaria subsp. sativa]